MIPDGRPGARAEGDPRDPYAPPQGGGDADAESGPPERPADDGERRRPFGQPPGPTNAAGGGPGPDQPVDRGGSTVLVLGIGALLLTAATAELGMTRSILYFVVGLVPGVAALVSGARVRQRAARNGARAPGALGGMIAGMIAATFCLGLLAWAIPVYDEIREYQSCLSGANTQQATERCEKEFRDAVENQPAGLPAL